MTIQQQVDYYVSEPGAPMPEEHFLDGGIDCGEHGDFDAEDRQDVISIDSTDAIMVGKYPQSSTHSFDWEPRQGVVSANDGADRLKPVMSLKNTQMGSTPAPFINPALLADEPCWSDEISDAHKNDMEWRIQPLPPLLRHPPSTLMHTNDGPGSRDTPLNAIIGPPGVPRAPNFGNRLQPARTEIPGEKFHMAIIESHTVIDQFGTLELEDSVEEGGDSEAEEDGSEDEDDSEMDED
ncbi:hypothetical protein ACKRZS_013502 [Fusarium odoratissimum]